MKKYLTIALVLALTMMCAAGASAEKLTSKQRYNINLFLSNFTEQDFGRDGDYTGNGSDTVMLTEFAIEHCWFNRQNRLEWGDYFNGNNVRLPEDQISPVVKKYFGFGIRANHNLPYIDYSNGYYYWEETGGHTSGGFCCLSDVSDLGNGYYWVSFDIFGMGMNWDNDVCYYTTREAERAYPRDEWADYWGEAVICVGKSGLNDRSDWTLDSYSAHY